MSKTERKRILSITVKQMIDDSPDTSYMGEYANHPANDYTIDRAHDLDCAINTRECMTACAEHIDTKSDDCAACEQEWRERRGDWCTCERGRDTGWRSREYRYFNPSFNYVKKDGSLCDGITPSNARKYTREDYSRMESLNAGQWCYIGIRAEAEVQLTGDLCQTVTSGGLWGIESDAGGFDGIAKDELAELRAQLHAMGFSQRAISAAMRNITHQDAA